MAGAEVGSPAVAVAAAAQVPAWMMIMSGYCTFAVAAVAAAAAAVGS